MTDEEIEIHRAELKEALRLAKEEIDRLASAQRTPAEASRPGPAGAQLAYENLKAAEVALEDFEIDYPAMP